MQPVTQTITELGRGNCLAACVASLLEMPLADVPNFREAEDSWAALQSWLAERGIFALKIRLSQSESQFAPVLPTHCILCGDSPRNPVLHAVVGVAEGSALRMVHDPHPDRTGLQGDPLYAIFLGIRL